VPPPQPPAMYRQTNHPAWLHQVGPRVSLDIPEEYARVRQRSAHAYQEWILLFALLRCLRSHPPSRVRGMNHEGLKYLATQ
jgi:hypothetical protein